MPVIQGRKGLIEVVIAKSLGEGIDASLTAIVGFLGGLVGKMDEGVPMSTILE